MFKSLNAICFGHYRVHARVARFDCNDTVAGRSLGMEKDGMTSGRFLRADSCSADRDMLNFPRVLIATPDLEIVNIIENVLVHETLVEIKIIEECGYALEEDTCLFEDESDSEERCWLRT
ncbi:hypothetical protein TSUD_370320 [Trifolium subterraneum]|uniref:Uncharacterized protein n=1 Tax=Trifolium subterraneum TaxID=3900 RepID=A0A2Z6N3D3_TRISU|nr:hypothetical protein TSUD_370320 [Trifolium subterraneum]